MGEHFEKKKKKNSYFNKSYCLYISISAWIPNHFIRSHISLWSQVLAKEHQLLCNLPISQLIAM